MVAARLGIKRSLAEPAVLSDLKRFRLENELREVPHRCLGLIDVCDGEKGGAGELTIINQICEPFRYDQFAAPNSVQISTSFELPKRNPQRPHLVRSETAPNLSGNYTKVGSTKML